MHLFRRGFRRISFYEYTSALRAAEELSACFDFSESLGEEVVENFSFKVPVKGVNLCEVGEAQVVLLFLISFEGRSRFRQMTPFIVEEAVDDLSVQCACVCARVCHFVSLLFISR